MIPILFQKTESSFTSNGLGRLSDAISCVVTEERNGQYELEMVYPLGGNLYDLIDTDMIIGAIPSVGASLQAFDIYAISRPLMGKVTINARHISYRLSHIVTTGANVAASGTACATALNSLKTNAILASGQTFPFTFETDVTTVAKFAKTVPASVRSRLGGSEGSILDQYGGEFEWDNFKVKLHKNRGVNSNVTIRYGKNLTDLTQDESVEGTITGCIGYWRSEDTTVVGTVQLAANHSEYVREKVVSVDFTSQLGTETVPTVEAVNNIASIYVNRHNLPNVNMKVSLIDLSKTEEYKEYAPLEELHLCDYVGVEFEKLGVSQYARVIKTVYNVLEDKYDSLEIGDNISTLFSTITDSLAAEIDAVSFEALNATAWLTRGNGYVVAVKNSDGSWKELLFMDTNDIATAHNVLRLNENGLGFSTTGVNGTYTNAWTIDGNLNADFITTGTLRASVIGSHSVPTDKLKGSIANGAWGIDFTNGTMNIGTLTVDKIKGSILNSGWGIDFTNGTMNIGTLSANKITTGTMSAQRISGGTLNLGGSNTDGQIVVKNASNSNIFTASKSGVTINGDIFTVTTTNFKLTSNGTMTANRATLNSATVNTATMNNIDAETISCTNLSAYGGFYAYAYCGTDGNDYQTLEIDTGGISLSDTHEVVEVGSIQGIRITSSDIYYIDAEGNWMSVWDMIHDSSSSGGGGDDDGGDVVVID